MRYNKIMIFKLLGNQYNNKSAFTLIELLVVIAIIGVLSTLAIVALGNLRAKSRDAKRVADIKQISTALELYYDDQGYYPTIITPGNSLASPDSTKTYLAIIPNNPSPRDDNNCPDNNYSYNYSTETNKYALGFCLGNNVNDLKAGVNLATVDSGLGNSGLIGWWKFDEGEGTTVYDSFGNHGTWSGLGTHYATGKVGAYAGQFNGSNDYLLVNNLPTNLSSGAYNTVAFWMKWSGVNGMVFKWNSQSYDLWLQAGCFGFNTYESNVLGVSSSGLANNWVFVTAIFYNGVPSASSVELYVNAVKQNLGNCLNYTTQSRIVSNGFYISQPGYYYSGLVDDIRVYNRALSVLEIKTLYDSTK